VPHFKERFPVPKTGKDLLQEAFPSLQRIGIYGNAKSILRKSAAQLQALKEHKLGIIYLGIETGDEATLLRVKKGTSYEKMVEAGKRVKAAGIKLSVTVLLGIAGVEGSVQHAHKTAAILRAIQPDYVGALTLMVMPDTPLHRMVEEGNFIIPSPFDLLQELRIMLAESDLHHCLFFSNHASNYLPIRARLPRDKESSLQLIDEVLASGSTSLLKPEHLRAL